MKGSHPNNLLVTKMYDVFITSRVGKHCNISSSSPGRACRRASSIRRRCRRWRRSPGRSDARAEAGSATLNISHKKILLTLYDSKIAFRVIYILLPLRRGGSSVLLPAALAELLLLLLLDVAAVVVSSPGANSNGAATKANNLKKVYYFFTKRPFFVWICAPCSSLVSW